MMELDISVSLVVNGNHPIGVSLFKQGIDKTHELRVTALHRTSQLYNLVLSDWIKRSLGK